MTIRTAQQPAQGSPRSYVAATNALLLERRGADSPNTLTCEASEVIASDPGEPNRPHGAEADVTRRGVVPGVPLPDTRRATFV
jgi:hypothetical protein